VSTARIPAPSRQAVKTTFGLKQFRTSNEQYNFAQNDVLFYGHILFVFLLSVGFLSAWKPNDRLIMLTATSNITAHVKIEKANRFFFAL
jgi:hypothetical protein